MKKTGAFQRERPEKVVSVAETDRKQSIAFLFELAQLAHNLPVQFGDAAVVLAQLLYGFAGDVAPSYQVLQQARRYPPRILHVAFPPGKLTVTYGLTNFSAKFGSSTLQSATKKVALFFGGIGWRDDGRFTVQAVFSRDNPSKRPTRPYFRPKKGALGEKKR